MRRRHFIRAKLADGPSGRLDIDPDLLDALLRAEHYTHGARSLEKLLGALKSPVGRPIRRSFLPPLARLGMHVDAQKFNAILEHYVTVLDVNLVAVSNAAVTFTAPAQPASPATARASKVLPVPGGP